jgi:hypothetical protein
MLRENRRVTRASAAIRGGLVAGLWAATLCGVAAAALRALHLPLSGGGGGYIVNFLRVFGQHLTATLMFVPAAVVAGALAGLFGRYAEAPPPWVRTGFLWFLFLPATALGYAVTLWIVGLSLPSVRGDASVLSAVLALPKILLGVAFFGLPWFAPGLALPLLGAAASVEGWTRPADQPATGLARPRVRTWTLALLAAASVGCFAFAAAMAR